MSLERDAARLYKPLHTLCVLLIFALFAGSSLAAVAAASPVPGGAPVEPEGLETDAWNSSVAAEALVARGIQRPSTAADSQVREVIEILAGAPGSKIPGPSQALKAVETQLQRGLQARGRNKGKIEVFFIIYGGSNGDVPLLSSVLQGMLDRPAIFDVKHAIVLGDSYRDFFPEGLKAKFANDNREWASKTNPPRRDQAVAMFMQKMASILHGWSPDLIVASHFIPPSATTPDQRRQIQQLTAPTRDRILVELQVFYLPGIRSTALTKKDIKPNHIRIYAQQPEIWDSSSPSAVGAAMVGKLPRLSARSSTARPGRQGEVYSWIDKQGKRPIFYMGMGMKERPFDKDHAFPAFFEVAKQELAALTDWSFIILHNVKRSESSFRRVTHNGRVFHLFVGETSWATLFPEMSLVLTHGGVGSMTDAIAAGVPQIILPTDYAADQTYFARRLERMGVGIGLPQIPYAALSKTDYVSVREIRDAFSKIRTNRKHYTDGIRPFRKNLADTNALDNTFELVERMCAGLVARN
ncbi:Sterol 3-beta-glucosyltransferase [Colletotrichum aenigma]|uniref:Sterol 3-beta-glucosyltransferase n=1 Tax=Colletotrichum aenigma TaxID=1215731 RepID=UPI0018729EC7|nr:Sterol 3-beta-glucosyltransferase [Colletotrichum aenigma]XP_037171342.1 Sterol 3-beta-glucosyltransferase [Colletotrichum aenigma]KAF5483147.1 Sterol 3-beta-glucosyltransferase [Colletotrichum aenigma]KAF5492725.1 Sterol 3-beta-glucosyltransferase [Colletotrichum aenigma]